MVRRFLIFSILLVVVYGCSKPGPHTDTSGNYIRIGLSQKSFGTTRLIDEDNLAVEQTIRSIAVFFADPSSDNITHSFINAGFSTSGEYRLVTIPLEPQELGIKDIYVITNYGNIDLGSITTVTQMRELTTPEVDKTNNLDPSVGFCMYGTTKSYDFTANTASPALVVVERTCAKLSVTLTFPEDTELSSDNSFLVTHAAGYTHVTDDVVGFIIPSDEYFNFASNIALIRDSSDQYINLAYVYEATQAPSIYLYTHINGSPTAQEYTIDLPIPMRNHLYDIQVRMYEEETRSTNKFRADMTINIHAPNGELQDVRQSQLQAKE